MAQYPSYPNEPRRMNEDVRRPENTEGRRVDPDVRRLETTRTDTTDVRQPNMLGAANVASPAPLGLGIIGIVTAILGCFYTGFIIPYQSASARPAVGAITLVLAIILVLAGMWEFRKNYLMTATLFTAYGGVLGILGVVFVSPGITGPIAGNLHLLLALVFLCWTIYLGVLCIGAMRTNVALSSTMVLLFVSFFFLMLGSFAFNNGVLIRIGGWVAIATALVAWLASIASIIGIEMPHELFHVPLGHRLASIE